MRYGAWIVIGMMSLGSAQPVWARCIQGTSDYKPVFEREFVGLSCTEEVNGAPVQYWDGVFPLSSGGTFQGRAFLRYDPHNPGQLTSRSSRSGTLRTPEFEGEVYLTVEKFENRGSFVTTEQRWGKERLKDGGILDEVYSETNGTKDDPTLYNLSRSGRLTSPTFVGGISQRITRYWDGQLAKTRSSEKSVQDGTWRIGDCKVLSGAVVIVSRDGQVTYTKDLRQSGNDPTCTSTPSK